MDGAKLIGQFLPERKSYRSAESLPLSHQAALLICCKQVYVEFKAIFFAKGQLDITHALREIDEGEGEILSNHIDPAMLRDVNVSEHVLSKVDIPRLLRSMPKLKRFALCDDPSEFTYSSLCALGCDCGSGNCSATIQELFTKIKRYTLKSPAFLFGKCECSTILAGEHRGCGFNNTLRTVFSIWEFLARSFELSIMMFYCSDWSPMLNAVSSEFTVNVRMLTAVKIGIFYPATGIMEMFHNESIGAVYMGTIEGLKCP